MGVKLLLLTAALTAAGQSQTLPEGPGKELVEVICTACHTLERVVAKQATKMEWQDKVLEMLQEDPDVTQAERNRIVEYLAANFKPAKINVNKAAARELANGLELPPQVAEAVVRYRQEKGAFKTVEDLKKVPGLDAAAIEAKRERLEF